MHNKQMENQQQMWQKVSLIFCFVCFFSLKCKYVSSCRSKSMVAFPLFLFKLLMTWLKFPNNAGLKLSHIKTGKCNQCSSAPLRNISVNILLAAIPLSRWEAFLLKSVFPDITSCKYLVWWSTCLMHLRNYLFFFFFFNIYNVIWGGGRVGQPNTQDI